MARRFAAFAVAALLAAGSGHVARADKPTLAVVPFNGPQARQAEAVVVRALRKKAQLIPPKTWSRAAAKLFAHTHSPEDIAAVADDVGAKVVITGVVKRDGRRWELSVSVRDGSDGKSRSRLRYPIKGPRLPPSTLALLAREIGDAFDAVANGEAPPPKELAHKAPRTPPPSTTPSPSTPPPSTAPSPGEPPAGREEPPPGTTPPPSGSTPPPREARQEPPPSGKRPRWAPWFELDAGGSITGRSFDFNPASQPRFTSGVVAGIRGDFTLYPLAFTWNKAAGVFSGLGLGATVDRPFWPDSTSKANPALHFATAELRVEGGLRWRIVLYKKIPRPQLLLLAGGGLHTFALGKDANGQDVGPADVAYKYITVGAGFRIHFAEWSYLWAAFNYHVVLSTGPITDVMTEYGPANTFGLRFSGGLDFFVYKGLKLGAQGFYERFSLQFLQGQPMPLKQAISAVDQYFGGIITVGYVL